MQTDLYHHKNYRREELLRAHVLQDNIPQERGKLRVKRGVVDRAWVQYDQLRVPQQTPVGVTPRGLVVTS